MIEIIAPLLIASLLVACAATALAVRVGRRAGALDAAGVEGQTKAAARPIPNIGGIGIVVGLLVPLIGAGICAKTGLLPEHERLRDLAMGLASTTPQALVVIAGLLAIHVMGLIDDRRPLSWGPKLACMVLIPAAVAWLTDTRVLTSLDQHAGGAWLSIGVTALWFAVVMNAINFMDNMDGLAGGTSAVIAAAICGVASLQQQWLVAGAAACLCGASSGFLVHNFPRARIFMGDGGSLVLGFGLAFLTTRLTYLDSELAEPRWDRLLIPFVLLAVPLYDMLSVVLIRLSQGKSPFVGDLQHLSHRFEQQGLSRPGVAASVWALASITGLGALIMAGGSPWQSVMVCAQTIVTLALLASLERALHRGTP